jgi:hypothetical protein
MNRLPQSAASVLVLLLLSTAAIACPTCKDALAQDPAGASLARGYAYSILFMLSMPPLIFGGLSLYFYWLVRQAKKQASARAAEQLSLQSQ